MYMKDGIRCNAIASSGRFCYGTTKCRRLWQNKWGTWTAPEPGEMTDIANIALFLASEESSYISGIIMPVDGGWTSF